MVLSASILDQIRDEIGTFDAATYTDGVLEDIYEDEDRGNLSTLTTALIVWRRRLHDITHRSFDLTTEGSLLSRNQRIRFMERRIKALENLVDDTLRGTNMASISTFQQSVLLADDPEFDA